MANTEKPAATADPNGLARGVANSTFDHVRQRMLLTDNEPHQHRLYESLGFHDVSRLEGVGLRAFVDIRGANLTSS